MEIAAEEVLARNIQFHQEGGREAQLDRIQIIETHHMAVERRQREFGHEVQTIGNPEGLGHHLVIGAHEQGIPGAGAGVRIDDWMLEGRIGGDVEGQQRGQSPAEAVPTDREGADRRLPGEARQRRGNGWGACCHARRQGAIHGGKTVFRAASTEQEGTLDEEERGVMEPLEDPLGAAQGDDRLSSRRRLEDEADGDGDAAPQGIDVGGEVIRIDGGDDFVTNGVSILHTIKLY